MHKQRGVVHIQTKHFTFIIHNKKSRIRETKNAESSTDIFVSFGVKKGADSNFLSSPPEHLSQRVTI